MAENLSNKNAAADDAEMILNSVAATQRGLETAGSPEDETRLSEEDAYEVALLMQEFATRRNADQISEMIRLEKLLEDAKLVLRENPNARRFLWTRGVIEPNRGDISRADILAALTDMRNNIAEIENKIPKEEIAAFDQFTEEQGI